MITANIAQYRIGKWRWFRISSLAFLGALLLSLIATPSQAHWADLSVADITIGGPTAQMTLTFPTGLVASADDNRDGQLSSLEIQAHKTELQTFLGDRIRLSDRQGTRGVLAVQPADTVPANLQVTAGTHSTVRLLYTWSQPTPDVKIDYDLFLPGVATARCLATISHHGQTQSVIFSPENQELSFMQATPWYLAGGIPLAIAGCFVWGAMHALSPGHGKTIVGAYLVGAHATPQHALFLGLTTTITHTAGVFALGFATLVFSHFILPERLYPWLSFLSGLIVVDIGLRLLISRLRQHRLFKQSVSEPSHSHEHPHHQSVDRHHDHSHHGDHVHLLEHDHKHHSHHHAHTKHSHGHHTHSHALPGTDGTPVTWRNLLALGISGGLVPCPSALVVLLTTVAIGQVSFGLMLVLAFSLGLAGTLTGLGLLLVSARTLFERMPTQLRLVKLFPTLSALLITLLGLGISTQAVMQLGLSRP